MEGGERHLGKNPAVFLVKVLNFSDLAVKSGKEQKSAKIFDDIPQHLLKLCSKC